METANQTSHWPGGDHLSGNAIAGYDFDSSPNKLNGLRMVVMEMTLAFFGVVFNLIVLISIREKESLLNSTINVILANLCFANLVAAVFVKSIAIIYNGYAVAAAIWEVELAFCTIHTVSFRATWAVLPYSIVVLCWHGLAVRGQKIFRAKAKARRAQMEGTSSRMAMAKTGYRSAKIAVLDSFEEEDPEGHEQISLKESRLKHESSMEVSQTELLDVADEALEVASWNEGHQADDDDYGDDEGVYARNKSALSFIWFVALGYSVMAKEVMSKDQFVPCSVRQELEDKINLLSLVIAVGVPVLIGPIICPIIHIVLCCCNICCDTCIVPKTETVGLDADKLNDSKRCSCLLEFGLIFIMSLIFIVTYVTHMFVTEMYLASQETHFAFMAFKYCFGCLHLVLLPIFILLIRNDIRTAAVDVFLKRIQDKSTMTFEQMQSSQSQQSTS